MNRPFKTYNGGKNGSGVYQAIINQIPPHKVFISGFAGNCGVMANKAPAPMANIVIDLDAEVVEAWENFSGVTGYKCDMIRKLPALLFHWQHLAAPEKFLFLDPPYLDAVRSTKQDCYTYEMRSAASHKKLLRAAVGYQCNILISHYPCKLYDDALAGWRTKDIQGRTRKGMRTERLYMNYPEPTALHDYSYMGNDFRQREAYKAMRENMVAKFDRMTELERNYILQSIKHDNDRR